MNKKEFDIREEQLLSKETDLLKILLKDNSSRQNIIWATTDYEEQGKGFEFDSQITIEKITGKNIELIKPRSRKTKEEKETRSKNNAEVFTPSWLCNEQNNLTDEAWFGRKNVFNKTEGNKWITNYNKIEFNNNSWQDYVKSTRLEISCGEAPYLTSRYDTVTGKTIKVEDRIGMLDRKLRIVSENNDDKKDWIQWSIVAMKSIYGFDWQGDNILLARENLLYTYIEYYYNKFKEEPEKDLLKEVAEIISWNIWQMDGIKYVIPNSCKNEKQNKTYCKIMNWETNKKEIFASSINQDVMI